MVQERVVAHLGTLGVTPADLQRVQQTSFPASASLLEQLQTQVHKAWRQCAFALHPDRTGNDPDKAQLFRELTEVKEWFEQLKVQPARPAVQVVTVRPPTPAPPRYNVRPVVTSASGHGYNVHYVVRMGPG